MIVSFRDKQTKAIYDNESTKAARKRLPMELWRIAQQYPGQRTVPDLLCVDRPGPCGRRDHGLPLNAKGVERVPKEPAYAPSTHASR